MCLHLHQPLKINNKETPLHKSISQTVVCGTSANHVIMYEVLFPPLIKDDISDDCLGPGHRGTLNL